MKNKTSFLYLFLSFLLSVLLVFTSVLFILKDKAVNESYIKAKLEQSKYAEGMKFILLEEYYSIGAASNIEPAFFNDFLNNADFKADIDYYLEISFSDQKYLFDIKATEQTLEKKLTDYAVQKKYVLDDDTKTAIKELSAQCSELYRSRVAVPYIDKAGKLAVSYNKLIGFTSVIFLIVSILLFLGILLTRFKQNNAPYAAYSFIGSSLILGLPALYLLGTERIERIGINPQPLFEFVNVYLKGMLNSILILSAVFLISGIMMAITLKPVLDKIIKTKGFK